MARPSGDLPKARVGAIPAFTAEVLCSDPDAALALYDDWLGYSATSPHRPRTDGEREAFNRKHHPFPDIPRDWTF